MKEHRLRVLVIAGDPDRIQLLEEAFGEMEELRFAKRAHPACVRDYALDGHEALGTLRRQSAAEPHDAILIDISREAGLAAPAAFAALRSAAPPSAAFLLLASRETEAAALSLVRMGAQDYLTDSELDCAPLGRMLRCAVERSRFGWSRQSVSMVDDLTGLYNRHGVATLSEREQRLAASLRLHRWSIDLRLELKQASGEDEDLHRLELAEQLQDLAAEGLVAGRTSACEFVLMGLAATSAAAEAAATHALRRLLARCDARRIPVRARLSGGVDAALCENR